MDSTWLYLTVNYFTNKINSNEENAAFLIVTYSWKASSDIDFWNLTWNILMKACYEVTNKRDINSEPGKRDNTSLSLNRLYWDGWWFVFVEKNQYIVTMRSKGCVKVIKNVICSGEREYMYIYNNNLHHAFDYWLNWLTGHTSYFSWK